MKFNFGHTQDFIESENKKKQIETIFDNVRKERGNPDYHKTVQLKREGEAKRKNLYMKFS